jgi:ABC-type oligopeptide transport system substrate-binding subunit/class 3 adenylate cyclase
MEEREPSVREERKVVTALFADLVGSTALAERLDPEEAKLIVGEAITRIVRAVEDFGGTIKDLAGDGVLALFGAPTAHEDDPERAVRAGLRAAEEIRAYAAEVATGWGVEGFSVRVGITTGPVVVGLVGAGTRVEYGAVGDAVNTAARLQSAAEPGSVLVGAGTRTMVEPLFEWGPPRDLDLRGKADAVRAYAVQGTAPSGARVRGPERLRARLVGREEELAGAESRVGSVLQGTGGILFVLGEPGIGKTRLIAELEESYGRAAADRPGARWLEGRCVSYGEAMPYWPFRDLIREWLGVGGHDPELRVRVALRRAVENLFRARAEEVYPYLGAMLGLALEPDASSRLAELSPEALQYRTFEVVRHVLERLAEDGPVVVALEDLHWADPTSLQLIENLLGATESAAILLALSARPERDHLSWRLKEAADRQFPHRTQTLTLTALSQEAERDLLHALVGPETLPPDVEDRIRAHAEGNPFFLEQLVGSLVDAGALVPDDGGWRFEHEVEVEVPATVENVILARLDRLTPACRDVLTAASVLGRRFGLPLLEGVARSDPGNGDISNALHELQRLDLIREGRRWPEPEYRFKHALIQETAYRTLVTEARTRLHRRAAEWLEAQHADTEDEVAGLLAHHWCAAEDPDKAITYLTRAADKARQEHALDEAVDHYRALLPLLEERGERREIAVALFKLALALHTALRFGEANETYQRAFRFWDPPQLPTGEPTATLRIATSLLPNDPDPKTAIAWPNIQLCMQLFDRLVEAWPERTLVPSLAERWDIADDGLRYVFHLREGLAWSDGAPLTAHDIEFGIKRVLNPDAPGSSVAIYFVLENGQDYAMGRNRDADRIGVRALDDRTVEFRLAAPAPYFMSVMNRPDGGPQPRHAIEEHEDTWTEPGRQVVSGPFRQDGATAEGIALERQGRYGGFRAGNVRRVEYVRMPVAEALEPYRRDELDVVTLYYTPRGADLLPSMPEEAVQGGAGWSYYVTFDHRRMTGRDVRRALAHAIDREALGRALPSNLIVATGGIVPPALQGHTPDIAPRFDPDQARELLGRSRFDGPLEILEAEERAAIARILGDMWRETLGLDVRVTIRSYAELAVVPNLWDLAPIVISGWLPGYPDPEYYLRLLLHSESRTNEGGYSHPPFDDLIERARQERDGRARLELFHQADRMAVAEQAALIPVAYGRAMAFVKPWVQGWSEFGKTSTSFSDLVVTESSPRV